MARSKTTKKSAKKSDDSSLVAATSILFAGTAVILVGNIQYQDNIKLLLIGFGAAMLVFAGVLFGMATKPLK